MRHGHLDAATRTFSYNNNKKGESKINKIPATLIEGDGIGPEITEATVDVLHTLQAPFAWSRFKAGLAALEESGDVLPTRLRCYLPLQ